ncbi:hypothetical protein KKA66_03855, partial [Patescibacteria group bacterium]|nr:hypothetical protein [Patescibacteria group bacterium]
ELNTELNTELKQEGLLREIVRTINDLRKKAGLTIGDKIEIKYNTSDELLKNIFNKFSNELKKQTLADELLASSDELEKIKVNDLEIGLCITKT